MMLFIIFSLLTGYVVDVEVHTPNGRVDIVLLTDIRLYIIFRNHVANIVTSSM
jgi:hypothetical protein